MIRCIDISFSFDKPVLDRVTCVFPAGVTALMGRNGSGKTTLLKLLAGLLTPQAGVVEWSQPDASNALGMVFQESEKNLLPWRTVLKNIALARAGAGQEAPHHSVSDIAALGLGVERLLGKRAGSLSGGERQSVALAAWLLARPAVLLLDEAWSMLDPSKRARLFEVLRTYGQATDHAVVAASHRLEDSLRLADRIVILPSSPSRPVREFALSRDGDRGGVALELADVLAAE